MANTFLVKPQIVVNAHDLLNDNQFYKEATKKKRIILHHTAGGTAKSSIAWWNEKPDHIATPYIIDRDGTIYETFEPKFWAYGLGLTNGTEFEKSSIQIEMANYGWLSKIKGLYYAGAKEVPAERVQEYKNPHRGQLYYERYTQAQINSVVFLIDKLSKDFGINIAENIAEFWHYQYPTNQTLISHTTVRKDKSDIHPQPDLIKAIYNYAGCKATITE